MCWKNMGLSIKVTVHLFRKQSNKNTDIKFYQDKDKSIGRNLSHFGCAT